jgi:hypothetical protein
MLPPYSTMAAWPKPPAETATSLPYSGTAAAPLPGWANNGLTAVFGDLLQASAIQGGTDIEPSLNAASAMADLFGGSVPDASWLTGFLDGSWLTGML